MYLPSVSQVSRSTCLYYRLLPRHHFRLPDRYTSPPILSCDLSSEKTKRSRHRRSTWRWYGFPYVRTLCLFDAPPTPFSITRHVASSTVVFNCRLRFLKRSKTLKPFALFTVPSSFFVLKHSKCALCKPRNSSSLSISNFLQHSSDHKKVTLLLLLLVFVAF